VIRLAVSMGDPAGVGPEIIAAALAGGVPPGSRVLVFGSRPLLARAGLVPRPGSIEILPAGEDDAAACVPGRFSPAAARATVACLQAACDAVASAQADALVTGPINKQALATCQQVGPGQTEWLARRFGAELPVMAFWSPSFSVVLATTHLPLARVAASLDARRLERIIIMAHRQLAGRLWPRAARLALAALNPHGEVAGQPGAEEQQLLRPVVERLRERGIDISGPIAADTVFALARRGDFQVVVALYHDQGLAPLKALHFSEAVHLTLGLGVVRTSPDHGPAYDLAGSGRADPTSMRGALELAVRLTGTGEPP